MLRRKLLRRRMLVTIWKLIKDVYDLQGGSREILIPAKLFRARLEAYHRKRFDRDVVRDIVGRALQVLSEADLIQPYIEDMSDRIRSLIKTHRNVMKKV